MRLDAIYGLDKGEGAMNRKAVSMFTILSIALCFTVSYAYAAVVTGSIGASDSVIVVGGTVTLTCTYTSSESVQGTGTLMMSGPASDLSDPEAFDSWSTLHYWDGGT
jgi:hypothetical protein